VIEQVMPVGATGSMSMEETGRWVAIGCMVWVVATSVINWWRWRRK